MSDWLQILRPEQEVPSISTISGLGRRRAENLVEDAIGQLALGHLRKFDGGGQGEERRGVAVGVDAHVVAGHIVHDDGVGALAQQLGAAVLHAVLGLGGEADDELPGMAAPHHFGQDVFGGRKLERERAGALEFLLGDVDAGDNRRRRRP